jgi:hypothetical protein
MLRKVLTIGAMMLVGLIGFGGLAAAEPGYPADPTGSGELAFTGTGAVIEAQLDGDHAEVGKSFPVKGGGMLPGETVSITPTFTPAGGGLRRASAFATTTITLDPFDVAADADGDFAFQYSYPEIGILEFTATGRTSGRVAVVSVQVGPVSGASAEPSGTSMGGPIAIIAAAVIAAAALIFFGVLFMKRRKREEETVSTSTE